MGARGRWREESRAKLLALACAVLATAVLSAVQDPPAPAPSFAWPDGQRMALSFSFDDGRASQVDGGLSVFDQAGVRVTLYVVPDRVRERVADWRRAAERGHEIGNHSLTHPCTGNFAWSRDRALEDYTLDRMRRELVQANVAIEQVLGVKARSFAYPCGQAFVGRGRATASYVPLVSELFTSGRGWLGEAPNDPAFVDLAHVLGVPMDDMDLSELEPLLVQAEQRGAWLVLAGHDIGTSTGRQVTRVSLLKDVIAWARAPGRRVWIDTVGTVADHIVRARR